MRNRRPAFGFACVLCALIFISACSKKKEVPNRDHQEEIETVEAPDSVIENLNGLTVPPQNYIDVARLATNVYVMRKILRTAVQCFPADRQLAYDSAILLATNFSWEAMDRLEVACSNREFAEQLAIDPVFDKLRYNEDFIKRFYGGLHRPEDVRKENRRLELENIEAQRRKEMEQIDGHRGLRAQVGASTGQGNGLKPKSLMKDQLKAFELNNEAWQLVERFYNSDQDYKEGLEVALKAWRLDPMSSNILNTLGVAYLRHEMPTEARRALERSKRFKRAAGESAHYDNVFLSIVAEM